MKASHLLAFVTVVAGASFLALSAEEKPRGPGGAKRGGPGRGDAPVDDVRALFKTDVPAHPLDVVLGRPTGNSVTASVLAYADRKGVIEYGPKPGAPVAKSAAFTLPAGQPVEVPITGLQPDTQYFYRLATREGAGGWIAEPERSFHTQRAPGSAFTFTVQADPHLDSGIAPDVYQKSLANVLAARADFHIDLGDTFMTDKYPAYRLAAPQYLAQRYYFSLVGHSMPVFLVLGNHDGETLGKGRGGDAPDAMAIWSNGMRKRYFPNPVPDTFYTGNTTPHPQAGLLQNYYAWQWGDALFIALDQYWTSAQVRKGSGDNWGRTLGAGQYAWLQRTLETSRAKFKFVFIHHLVGGETPEGRGGSEASQFFEWGGRELEGRDTFAERRPGWTAPIHDLLVKHGVSVVFHGHDHLYAQQERDGVIYQLVPQPGHSRYDNTRSAAEYGYKSGVIAGASGILRVSVSPARASVDYVRAYPDAAEGGERRTGVVTHGYEIRPR